jgi:uncharacterized damage-inducible protein DinB
MNTEILLITGQLKESYDGDPWFGKSVTAILKEVNSSIVLKKPNEQHSIVELLWHMILWRTFTLNRLKKDNTVSLSFFEENDWEDLDHSDTTLWEKGADKIEKTQSELVGVLQRQRDDLLLETVPGKTYNYRKLLYGIINHDIYHLGQIAYLNKMLTQAL